MPPSPSPVSASLLLEIGVEELPASFVDGALAALPDLTTTRLAALRLGHGAVRVLGTPRRLAVLVDAVATRQDDVDEEVVGPPETAAFKDGQPTKAAEAFANKLGVPVASLVVADRPAEGRQKAGRYVVGRRAFKGAPATEVLGAALTELCGAIPFRKSMRWGSGTTAFGRPVQWLVALHGARRHRHDVRRRAERAQLARSPLPLARLLRPRGRRRLRRRAEEAPRRRRPRRARVHHDGEGRRRREGRRRGARPEPRSSWRRTPRSSRSRTS